MSVRFISSYEVPPEKREKFDPLLAATKIAAETALVALVKSITDEEHNPNAKYKMSGKYPVITLDPQVAFELGFAESRELLRRVSSHLYNLDSYKSLGTVVKNIGLQYRVFQNSNTISISLFEKPNVIHIPVYRPRPRNPFPYDEPRPRPWRMFS